MKPMYDVFLSHASEDKEAFVRPLAEALTRAGLRVWYDEFALKPGLSLSASIDEGLRNSSRCVIVLSPAFFAKKWTSMELGGIVQRQIASPEPLIIPIWYGVGHAEVVAVSPLIADLVAIHGNRPLTDIASQIARLIRPVEIVAAPIQFASNPDAVTELAHSVLSHTFRSLDGVAVFVAGEETLRIVASSPAVPEKVRQLRIPKHHSLAGRAVTTKQPIVILDTNLIASGFSTPDLARSVVAVPIGDVVVMVQANEPQLFDTDEKVRLVTDVAQLIAAAVTNPDN